MGGRPGGLQVDELLEAFPLEWEGQHSRLG